MSDIQLLQGKEYIRSLYEDFDYAKKIRIECLTLNPIIADILIPQAKAGAKIEILTNPPDRKMIHGPDFLEVRRILREAGIKVYCFNAPYLHHQKIVLIDPDIVYLGSHNISKPSLNINIETSVRFRNFDIFMRLLNQFKMKTGTSDVIFGKPKITSCGVATPQHPALKDNDPHRQIEPDTGCNKPEPVVVYDIPEN